MSPPRPTTVELASPDGARAEVALQGAHVLSWHPVGSAESRLFLADLARWREGTAIRGGVPVIFPQFADRGPLAKHGFARTRVWEPLADDRPGHARFRLADDPATRAAWPHPFAAELTVAVGGNVLEVALTVENRGSGPLAFTGALHSYLRVADAAGAAVRGLRGTRFEDATAGGRARVEEDELVGFDGEVDRAYLDAPPRLELLDGGRPVLDLEASGFPDVVVWNPGPAKGAALADLEPGGFARFVCIEAAAVARPVELAPGEHWTGAQRLAAR